MIICLYFSITFSCSPLSLLFVPFWIFTCFIRNLPIYELSFSSHFVFHVLEQYRWVD